VAKAHSFVLAVYRVSTLFPKNEIYGLTAQLRRAAVSVPANFAEGFVKRGKPDKARLMNVAQGSLEEARYYLILANDLGYSDNAVLLQMQKKYLGLSNGTLSVFVSVSVFWLLASRFWLPVPQK